MIIYKLYNKDCRSMVELPDNSIHAVCTSPPYWGLRKYSGEQELIWGDNHCEHQFGVSKERLLQLQAGNPEFQRQWREQATQQVNSGAFCSLCGAWRGAFGLEPTPEMYIQHSVEILREIRRVVRKDGVVFWNIGDSYSGSWGNSGSRDGGQRQQNQERLQRKAWDNNTERPASSYKHQVLKPLDLCLIPERLAIALQTDSWWVRSIIVWHKPNPMPESVNGWRWEQHRIKIKVPKKPIETRADRPLESPNHPYRGDGWETQAIEGRKPTEYKDCPGCTKCSPNDGYVLRKGSWRPTDSYEQILMLTKTGSYYCDAEAVREPSVYPDDDRKARVKDYHKDFQREGNRLASGSQTYPQRNLRNVWSFPTVPYPGAHFAVFPEKLPELCIKATTPEVGVCAKCGAPWARVVEKEPAKFNIRVRDALAGRGTPEEGYKATKSELEAYKNIGNHPDMGSTKTLGWRPTCSCNCPEKVPATVLDPFAGAGTTLLMAIKLGRSAVGYELSSAYCDLANKRIDKVQIRYS